MYLIENIKIYYTDDNEENLLKIVKNKIGITNIDLKDIVILKKSLDARNKNNIHYNYSILIDEKYNFSSLYEKFNLPKIDILKANKHSKKRPIIIGFGPAGIFAGYYLAKSGLKPIIFERGKNINDRIKDVNKFWNEKILNTESNVQFGEGGAGTFSDGKLTSRSKDILTRKIKEILVEFGADKKIIYESKAHIGTDKLRKIIPKIREEIINLGGEINFNCKMTDIVIDNNEIKSIIINSNEKFDAEILILALGHSARDTFELLFKKGIYLETKPFAVGFRIEHEQEFINISQYGKNAKMKFLPPAEYVLKNQYNGRGCFSFCMCPGGFIINATNDLNQVVVNGMSNMLRDGKFANSAIVVTIDEKDFYKNSPLDGIYFQKHIEEKAFSIAGKNYSVPASYIKDYINNKISKKINKSSLINGLAECDLNTLYSKEINEVLKNSFKKFNILIPHFIDVNPVLIAPETRTSSPIRIKRNNDTYMSINIKGLYPCGEGAGYAGGIISAAIDGFKIAEKIVQTYFL